MSPLAKSKVGYTFLPIYKLLDQILVLKYLEITISIKTLI